MFEAAGLDEIEETGLSASLELPSFEGWWEPFTLDVGPAGSYLAGLDEAQQAELRETCRTAVTTWFAQCLVLPISPRSG